MRGQNRAAGGAAETAFPLSFRNFTGFLLPFFHFLFLFPRQMVLCCKQNRFYKEPNHRKSLPVQSLVPSDLVKDEDDRTPQDGPAPFPVLLGKAPDCV